MPASNRHSSAPVLRSTAITSFDSGHAVRRSRRLRRSWEPTRIAASNRSCPEFGARGCVDRTNLILACLLDQEVTDHSLCGGLIVVALPHRAAINDSDRDPPPPRLSQPQAPDTYIKPSEDVDWAPRPRSGYGIGCTHSVSPVAGRSAGPARRDPHHSSLLHPQSSGNRCLDLRYPAHHHRQSVPSRTAPLTRSSSVLSMLAPSVSPTTRCQKRTPRRPA